MNFYPLVRSLLFLLDAEKAHDMSLKALAFSHRHKWSRWFCGKNTAQPVKVMGIEFPNRVGLAAGLDKNGDYFIQLADCGFGFVEIGTVTPRPQPGNPQPRLFRIPEARAIINRMGFNNQGVDYLVSQVQGCEFKGVLGINIGKNFDTPVADATEDYLICLEKVYPVADYIAVNISSPNTPGLRDLQFGEALDKLLQSLKQRQKKLADESGRYVPITVKIAPDMEDSDVRYLAERFIQYEIDGVIATNTTFSREGVEGQRHADEQGGLSGAPLNGKSDQLLKVLCQALNGKLPVIAVGGIMSVEDARRKIHLGASLVQVYTGFIYKGPALIQAIARGI